MNANLVAFVRECGRVLKLGTEQRVLAGMITDPLVLAQCDDVEVWDFSDWRNRTVLAAIRGVQRGARAIGIGPYMKAIDTDGVVCVEAVLDEIEAMDVDHAALTGSESHRRDYCGALYIAHIIIETTPYNPGSEVLELDLRYLRKHARAREEQMR